MNMGEINEYANSVNAKVMIVSAKENVNITEAFIYAAKKISDQYENLKLLL